MMRLLWLFPALAYGAVFPLARGPGEFHQEGLVEGGKDLPAAIAGLRLVSTAQTRNERWEITFLAPSGDRPFPGCPRLQAEYLKEEGFDRPDGGHVVARPARLVFRLRSIRRNPLTKSALERLTTTSPLTKQLTAYPPIEDGDIALEWSFRSNVSFALFEPPHTQGKLILELKPR